MAYDKIKWVNNQTKLSATNFNHMEQGIENAHSIAEEAERTANAAYEAATSAKDTVDNITEHLEEITAGTKQDTLVSGVNIKTVNGQSILGEGDLVIQEDEDINYQSVDGVSLDELTEEGVYSVVNALNYPVSTANQGTLRVTKLSDTEVEQEWKSKINSAQRILTVGDDAGSVFKVNGVPQAQGTIQLEACGTYELTGCLEGHIVIGHGELKDTLNNRTKIILNNVSIFSDVDYAIDYTPKDKRLVVEIANGTENYLVVDIEGEHADADPGVINSENGLAITGVGYLSVRNTRGHGFKASELYVDGNPHIYVDAEHDAFHGKNLLKITDGYFYVANANDAFTAGHDDPDDDGRLFILGGEYHVAHCNETAFESRSSGAKQYIVNSNIYLGEVGHAVSSGVKVLAGLNNLHGAEITETDPADFFYFTNGPIIQNADTLDQILPDANNVFTLVSGSAETTEYKVSGNFTGYKIITKPLADDKKIDLIFNDVYYNDSEETDPFILHTSTTKRVKIKTNDDKLIFIKKAHGNIIQSNKGVQITSKGDVIIDGCGTADCGVFAPNSYALFSGDGLRRITGCSMGVYADNIRLGEDPDDIINKFGSNPTKRSASDDPIYIIGNTTDALITTSGDELTYQSKILATQYHTGITILGSIAAENSADVSIEALTGEVLQKVGQSYVNTAVLYTAANVENNVGARNYVAPEDVKAEIPSIDEVSSSPWTVYSGDGYSKAAADEKFVSKAVYDALKAELDARAPKKINIINYVVDTSKTDGRPLGDHAYCPVTINDETVYVADSIDIYRYACPERIDIDDAPETHKDYVKDGRPIYARDGDFGYPEIDKTGQFNFKPNWNTPGYVLQPRVTPADGYNNFKTQWNTGIPGLYRFTKVNSDLTIELNAVLESEIPAHTITYNVVAPLDYPVASLPTIRIFRGADHLEKYVKYGPGAVNPPAHPELDEGLISGNVLEMPAEPIVVENKNT